MRKEAEAYVTANKRSAESLLAAFRASKDKAYLREALGEVSPTIRRSISPGIRGAP